MMNNKIGWKHYLNKVNIDTPIDNAGRIITENKTNYSVQTDSGNLTGIISQTFKNSLSHEQQPKVGDYVLLEKLSKENKAKIVKILPRFSVLSRTLPGKNDKSQIIATNIDIMFLTLGQDQDNSIDQVRRFITLAKTQSIRPIILLNKSDLKPKDSLFESRLKKLFPHTSCFNVSAKSKVGIDRISAVLKPDYTAVFVGNSGAGKTSLINVLFSDEILKTLPVRKDGKGRHATTRREMWFSENGGIIIDTPGIRTLELSNHSLTNDLSINSLNPELSKLMTLCKFRDCDHVQNQGCAVLQALTQNKITLEQYKLFLKQLSDLKLSHNAKANWQIKKNKTQLNKIQKKLQQSRQIKKRIKANKK